MEVLCLFDVIIFRKKFILSILKKFYREVFNAFPIPENKIQKTGSSRIYHIQIVIEILFSSSEIHVYILNDFIFITWIFSEILANHAMVLYKKKEDEFLATISDFNDLGTKRKPVKSSRGKSPKKNFLVNHMALESEKELKKGPK